MDKLAIVNKLIGKAYDLRGYNCWHCAGEVLEKVYGRTLPKFRARDALSPASRLAAMKDFKGWADWKRTLEPQDGAVLLMQKGGCIPDLHAGVFVHAGRHSGVVHCDDPPGCVLFDDLLYLKARGFTDIRMFVPA